MRLFIFNPTWKKFGHFGEIGLLKKAIIQLCDVELIMATVLPTHAASGTLVRGVFAQTYACEITHAIMYTHHNTTGCSGVNEHHYQNENPFHITKLCNLRIQNNDPFDFNNFDYY